MLLFIILLVVVFVIWVNWHYAHIIQQCDTYINLIDTEDNAKNVNKIPECVSFLEKNWTKIRKKAYTDNQYQDKIGEFLIRLGMFMENKIYDKNEFIYRKQLSDVLTYTIKDKDLKKQIITEIKNSKYIPKIKNNEEEHFTYNLLNHYVHKGNPVDWEYIEIEYPNVFKNINSLCLKYLTDNKYTTDLILSELQRIGEEFAKKDDFFKVVTDIVDSIYAEDIDLMKTLTYLQNKKVVKPEKADEYKKQYNNCIKMLEINHKKMAKSEQKRDEFTLKENDELWKKYHEIKKYILNEYVRTIIKNGDLDEYIKLSEKLGRLLFRVDSPGRNKYLYRSNDNWLKAHKKMLDARIYGINLLLLFFPKDFENESYDTEYYSDYLKKMVETTVSADCVLKFKQDIDTILSAYYPVPNFLNHAKEILDAYITGSTPFEKNKFYDYTTWHNNYDKKIDEIQLQTLSLYEIFGYTIGYLTYCVNIGKRVPAKYLQIKDSAFIAYLDSLGDKTFDDSCKLCARINKLQTSIYN